MCHKGEVHTTSTAGSYDYQFTKLKRDSNILIDSNQSACYNIYNTSTHTLTVKDDREEER